MTRRVQLVIVLLLTMAMLVIFISPAVPFAPTTLRARPSVAPMVLATHAAPVLPLVRALVWQPAREALVLAHSPDVLDLTSARLC